MRSILRRAFALASVWAITTTAALAGPNAEPLERALQWLEAQQSPADGAWHGATPSATLLQTTAAAQALQLANRRSAAWYVAQAWLENHTGTNSDALARRLRALRTRQANVADELETLWAARNGSGWGLSARYQPDALDSALALAALWQAGSRFDVRSVLTWLGGGLTNGAAWPTGSATAGMLACVLEALAPAAASDAALGQTLRTQLANLGPDRLANAQPGVRALASLAWQALLPQSQESRTLLAGLREAQAATGGVGGNIFATALLAQALARAEAASLAEAGQRVAVEDPALRAALNAALGRSALDDLTRADLALLTSLDLDGRNVRSLRGLEYAVNLRQFTAGNSPIADFSPLSNLTQLASSAVARRAPQPDQPVQVLDGETEPQPVPMLPGHAAWLAALVGLMLVHKVRARAVQAALLVVGLGLATQIYAAAPTPGPSPALAPPTLDRVKVLSQHLLQANAAQVQAPAALETLAATRAAVANLESALAQSQRIALDTAPVRGSQPGAQLPEAEAARARVVIKQLREAAAPTARGATSGNLQMALAAQRSALFQRWASDLEATLAPEVPDRLARLTALRRRLANDSPSGRRSHLGSPTLQALPAPRK